MRIFPEDQISMRKTNSPKRGYSPSLSSQYVTTVTTYSGNTIPKKCACPSIDRFRILATGLELACN